MTKRHSMRLFYIDGETHVSIPYTQLDGPMAETGASTPKSFIARVGKNTDYALPYDPECVHMRERSRKYMEPVPGLNTICSPNGHYAFRPEPGRGCTWLHFALLDETLALDSRNVGCRLLKEISAEGLDGEENETGETVIPAGEVLRFLSVNGESENYYYMSSQYSMYQSGARDYLHMVAVHLKFFFHVQRFFNRDFHQ